MMNDYTLVRFDKFEPKLIHKKRHAGKYPIYTATDFISLDTETSHNADRTEAWLYQWCFSYPGDEKRQLVYGRKPSELAAALKKVHEVNKLNNNERLIVYVHNLSYDYCYIKDAIEEAFGFKGTLLAVGDHKLLSYEIDGLIFKCSFRLSLKSLDNWCKELGTKHRKLKGTIDYDVERFQDSPLTMKDWKYMFYDIVCLDEAVKKQLEKWNDTLITIPLTNTGYVRREAKKFFAKSKANRQDFVSKELDLETYSFCRKEFAGGLTHGNRFFADKTVHGTIKHRDFASHYPSQQMCYSAPCSKFTLYYEYDREDEMNIKDLYELTKEKCILCAVIISNLTVRNGVTLPYAQISKFREGALDKVSFVEDNGRILHQECGHCLVVVNEYDLKWLLKQYKFDYSIQKVYIANRGAFPQYLRDTVQKFFYDKSFYKAEEKRLRNYGFAEDSPEYKDNHLNMMIAKGMLNAVYGMSATDPVRVSYFENEDGEWEHTVNDEEDIVEALSDFYKKKSSFMNYELGCWTTALARNELLEFVELIGYENFLYADTDSIFYISSPEVEQRIEERNKMFREVNDQNGWFIEIDGKRTYYNQFEDEKEDIVEFRFLHSKCYAYVEKIEDKLELHTTIAGVKKFGRNNNSRVKELGSIDNLTTGTKFTDCGGTMTEYVNRKFQELDIEGHLTEVSSAAIIKPREITLKDSISLTEEDFICWEVSDIE